MAIYDFKCHECGTIEENVILPIAHVVEDRPRCCDEPMLTHITQSPLVHWKDYILPDGGFKAYSMPGAPVITSLKENRELMERHNLIDGNDLGTPPTKAEQMAEHNEKVLPSIGKITPTAQQAAQLQAQGLMDSVE
jgi:hypothetical protein